MRFHTRDWTCAVVLLALSAGIASAFVPPQDAAVQPVMRPGSETPPMWSTEELSATRSPGADAFLAFAGGRWQVQWNGRTGTPHSLFGSGVQISTGSLDTEAQAEAAARSFVAEHRELLGVRDLAGLRLVSVVNGLGKWGVIFEQDHAGIPVEGAVLRLVMTDAGRLYYIGSDWHPEVGIAARPGLSLAVARDISGREVGFQSGRDTDRGSELRILPVPSSESSIEYRLVWRTHLDVAAPLGSWVSFVDAQNGRILWRYNDICFVDVVGTTTGSVEDFGYCYGEFDRRLPHMQVNVSGGNSGYSDANGNYTISHPGSTPVTVTAQLDGRWINVNNQGGSDATFTGTATPGVPFEIRWIDANSRDDERDVYLHGNRIHDLVKRYDPPWTPPDYRMTSNVNINSTCNAYWYNGTINFYRAGGSCGNTGQMGDVIYHEYGHGITQWIYGNNPSDVGEGNSDIAAAFIDGNSIIGEGFYINNCSSGIRNLQNNLRYPQDYQAGQIHFNGQIIGGFYWDARTALIQIYGESGVTDVIWPIWHFARRMIRPLSMPDQVLAAFVTDDDDGNLNNGTPHYDAFCFGATNHGFTCPAILPIEIRHSPLDATETQNVAMPFTADVIAHVAALDPSTVWFEYAVNGAPYTRVPLTNVSGTTWQGTIPGQRQPAEIAYYISASDVLGNTMTAPPGGAADPFRFEIAYLAQLFEAGAGGWTVGDAGDNATTGIWILADPVGTTAQPEDDHTTNGINCWVTGNGTPGGAPGDNDVDGGKTTLKSAAYNLTGAYSAKAKYWRWYSNDKGNNPNQDTWLVQVRNNGGAWTNVESTTASSNAWVQRSVDLLALYGASLGTVEMRFVASDEGSASLVEAAVDDFVILADMTGPASAEGAGAVGPRFALRGAMPNPFNPRTARRFEGPAPIPVWLAIHDVEGRLVRTLIDGQTRPAGESSIEWDGTDADGRPVDSGVYFIRMNAETFQASRPIVLLK